MAIVCWSWCVEVLKRNGLCRGVMVVVVVVVAASIVSGLCSDVEYCKGTVKGNVIHVCWWC